MHKIVKLFIHPKATRVKEQQSNRWQSSHSLRAQQLHGEQVLVLEVSQEVTKTDTVIHPECTRRERAVQIFSNRIISNGFGGTEFSPVRYHC